MKKILQDIITIILKNRGELDDSQRFQDGIYKIRIRPSEKENAKAMAIEDLGSSREEKKNVEKQTSALVPSKDSLETKETMRFEELESCAVHTQGS